MDLKVNAVFVWVPFNMSKLGGAMFRFNDLHLFHECKGGELPDGSRGRGRGREAARGTVDTR